MAVQAGAAVAPQRVEPVVLELQGEGFHAVLAAATGKVLITNDTGRAVLELCDGARSAADIAAEIAGRHPDVPADQIRGDVTAFLDAARDKGVLRW